MLVRIEPFSIRNNPSLSVPAMIVSPITASDVTASPISIGESHTDAAMSRRSIFSEKYPPTYRMPLCSRASVNAASDGPLARTISRPTVLCIEASMRTIRPPSVATCIISCGALSPPGAQANSALLGDSLRLTSLSAIDEPNTPVVRLYRRS